MISTLLVDMKSDFIDTLETHLTNFCPQIEIKGKARSFEEAHKLIKLHAPDLIFMDISIVSNTSGALLNKENSDFETIFLSSRNEKSNHRFYGIPVGHLYKPFGINDLMIVLQHAQSKIALKHAHFENKQILSELLKYTPPNDVISIPTIEGIEFLKINEIIRCEGLQKYTRIYTIEKSDIISSYSIGQFFKLWDAYGFFASHKSHLINLQHIRRFIAEGTIIMRDGSAVPVSRRRRSAFLQRVNNFKLNR